MKNATQPLLSSLSLKIGNVIGVFASCAVLWIAFSASAGSTYTWNGSAGDLNLQNTNNWSPVTAGHPASSANDTLQWDGTVSGNLVLTNGPGNGTVFDSNPGFYINVLATQTGSLTLVESNGFTGRIRLNGTNTVNLASGAGALSFGNGGTTYLPVALAGRGNGETHPFTNNSANTVTFNSDTYFVMGGGGAHTLITAGSGNFVFNTPLQADNGGAGLGLAVDGSGRVTINGGTVIGASGNYNDVTVNSGTLVLGSATALGANNHLIINGGGLDSALGLANPNTGASLGTTWNSNFVYVGSLGSLDLGFAPVTIPGFRTVYVTVNANTLEVDGNISGTFSVLGKDGPGTLLLTGINTYSGGTVISNGVLQIGAGFASAFPVATNSSTAPESLGVYGGGTFDVDGNSLAISSLNGSGTVDTTGGSATLTLGDQDANGSFTGVIENSSGALSVVKTGTGQLVLSGASTYSGGTTVNAGALLVNNTSGSGTGSGAVDAKANTTFGGTGSVAGSVTWESGSTIALTGGSTFAVGGTVTLNSNPVRINVPGFAPLGPGTYTLMTYTSGGSSGTIGTVTFTGAGISPGTTYTVVAGGGTVTLTVTGSAVSSTWINNGNGNWSAGLNWNNGVPNAAGTLATFGVGTAFTTVTLDANETVGGIVFTNPLSFDIAGSGTTLTFDNASFSGVAALSSGLGTSNQIGASVTLNSALGVNASLGSVVTISGPINGAATNQISLIGGGTLTLSGNNTYGPSAGSIGTTINSSVLQLANNAALGSGDLDVTNTSLTGSSSTIRSMSPLNLANNVIVETNATAVLDDTTNAVTLSGVVSGAGAFAKNGSGTLTLSGANTISGGTTVNAGNLMLGQNNGLGTGNLTMGSNTLFDLHGFSPSFGGLNSSAPSAIVDSLAAGSMTLSLGNNNNGGTFDGNIQDTSGAIALVKNGTGTQILAGTNAYTGGTTINDGTLQIGNGNTNSAPPLGTGPVTIGSSGFLTFNLAHSNVVANTISGSGAMFMANTGMTLSLTGNNSAWAGNITNNGGDLWITSALNLGPSPKTIWNAAAGNSLNTAIHLNGSAGNITLDSGYTWYLTWRNGTVYNEGGNNTIAGPINLPYGGGNTYFIVKSGFLTLSGIVQSDGIAVGRTLQLGGPGSGLFSGVAQDNNGIAIGLDKTDAGTWTVSGNNTTAGGLTADGGILNLTGQWAGAATVNNGGTLAGTGICSNLTVNAGGKFVPGAYGSVGTFNVSNLVTLSGAMYVSLNKSLGQPNSLVNVEGTGNTNIVANSGSSVVVSNLGPALVAGDSFQLFSQAVTNGNLATIVGNAGAGLAFTNYLAVDGSIKVYQAVATNPTNILANVTNGTLNLSWPVDHTGWYLQAQTNSLSVGLSTNWVTIPGSQSTNGYSTTLVTTNGTVFYRLKSTP